MINRPQVYSFVWLYDNFYFESDTQKIAACPKIVNTCTKCVMSKKCFFFFYCLKLFWTLSIMEWKMIMWWEMRGITTSWIVDEETNYTGCLQCNTTNFSHTTFIFVSMKMRWTPNLSPKAAWPEWLWWAAWPVAAMWLPNN